MGVLSDPEADLALETETPGPAPPERQQDVRVVLNIGSKKHIVLRKKEIEDLALLRSMAMGSASSSSRQGLELLDDELIGPEVVALIWSQCVASSNG